MPRSSVTDPLRNFKFQVEIFPASGGLTAFTNSPSTSISKMGFAVVSGISVTNEVILYREGGMNTHPHKMVGQSDFAPVTFSKGVYADESALYNWHTFIHSWNQGSTDGGSTSGNNDYRADIVVTVFDHPVSNGPYATPGQTGTAPTPAGAKKLIYKLHNAWPASYSMTDLNAGDSSLLIQQLTVNHEGFNILWADSAGGTTRALQATD